MKSILNTNPARRALTAGGFVLPLIAAGGALAAEGGAASGGMPQLDPSSFPSQIFWLIVTFAVLFLLMWKVALPRVGEVIDQRQQKVSADLDRAETLKEEVEKITAEYEKLLSEARGDANEEIRKAQDQIKTTQDHRLERHDTEISAMISEAEKRIAKAREEALAEIRGVAEETASATVAKLIGQTPDKKAVSKAVEQAAKEA
jgi:F-type H+-transporting ATPase subunit b